MVMAEDNDPVIDEIDEDDGDGDDLVDIEAEGEDQDMKPLAEENVCIDTAEPMEVEEEEPPPEDTPILLSESSQAKLDAPRRSVLFASASSHSFLTATATAAEVVGAKPLEAPAVLSGSAPAAAISVYSWGPGSAGSLHDDASDRTWDTARVSAASRLGRVEHVLSVSTSGSHSAVATPSGLLTCGLNDKGQVDPLCSASATTKGVVVNNSIPRPTLLESINVPVVQVSCGADHTAAVTSTGVVLTWGSNEYGQLGHPNRSSSLSLMSVAPSSSSSSGTTMIRPRDTFVRPQAMALSRKRAYSVACGDGFTVVLTTRMEVLCCGVQSIAGYETPARRLSFSMLSPGGATTAPAAAAGIPGSAASHHHPLPSTLPELECLPIVAIAAGRHHAAAVTAHGSVLAWGENTRGCCGRASPKVLHIPVPIRIPRLPGQEERTGCSSSGGGETDAGGGENPFPSDDSAVVHVACGDEHTVLLTRSGRALVCGSNEEGQLGVARDSDAVWYHVIPLTFGRKIVDARAGRAHTLLLDDEGDLWVLGDGNPTPKRLLHGEPVVAIAAGGSHSIAIASRPWPPIPPSAGMNREFSNLVAGSTRLDGPESIEELVRLVENAADPDDGGTGVESRDLAKRAEELMKTPAVLNSLFFEPRDLEDLFRKLISLRRLEDRQAMARAVEAGMKYALDAIKADNVRLICPESMRFLLLYMQCPLFVDCDVSEISFDVRSDVMIAICEVILGLSFEGYKAFISLVSMCYTRETFTKFLIRPLLRQLEKGLGAKAGPAERVVPLATGVLSWLHSASERAGGIARPEDFYSTAVNEMDSKDAFIDLYRWKKSSKVQRSKNFFLCAHPFLFSPESKRNLLQIENQMEMFNTATQDGVTYNVAEGIFEFDPYWVLEVEREQLLPQTLRKIADAKAKDLRKKLRIVFKGEEGVDAGGVTREFFQLISTQLFDVSSGLWLAPDQLEDEHITWFNPDCFWNDEGYYLVGILVGLAVYNNVLLDVNFPLAVYRKLLGLPLGIEDLPDRSVQKSLQELLDYEREDVEDVFCLNFAVDWVDLGRKRTVELKPGGLSIPVTADNKDDYVRLYVKWLLEESIHAQYDAFERGFMKIMQNSTLEFLSPEELELLVVGTRDLDFNALEANTEYEGGYDRNSEVIKHFWKFVKSSDSETQLKLLRFVTGSSKAPIGGLGKLSFKIQRAGPDSQQLPTSHTCFNTLLLNEYDSYDKLAAQLDRAIDECEGFGLQ
jgi:alpha-tubulin suppressor-like RCC1 family protein